VEGQPDLGRGRARHALRGLRCLASTDPRHYQIAVLGGLLAYGLTALDFEASPAQVAITIAGALGIQSAASLVMARARFDPRSALITACSLSLLLRTNEVWIAGLAAGLAVGSKFLVRVNGKHVFNPANLGIAVSLLIADGAWVSPGQWGSPALLGFALACLGTLVVTRASRADVSFTFLAAYAGMMIARALWLGDPLTIPLHRLQSGALLLFAFFMISDPRTTPDARGARMLFAVVVAAIAWYIHFALFRTNGLIWALALSSPLVPVLDRVWPADRYQWPVGATGARPWDAAPAVPSQGVRA
jgi:Na+-transporting NADH:ubiquinone oxidoreductase subunit NqrB